MISLVTDNPKCTGWFGGSNDTGFICKFTFTIGKQGFESDFWTCPSDLQNELLDSFEATVQAQNVLGELMKEYPSEMKLMARCPKGPDGLRSFAMYEQTWHKLLRRLEHAYETFNRETTSLTDQLVSRMRESDTAFELSRKPISETSLKYAYCKGRIWSSRISLDEEQWLALVDRALDRERLTLDRSTRVQLRYDQDPESSRIIPVDVRREVWRRDLGRCTTCGSQERLEFDHIIPVSMGGSNTVRNVQLLCEFCNREKGPTLG